MSKEFRIMDGYSKSIGETNDCAVKAVASACYQEYSDVLKMFYKAGRKPRSRTLRTITIAVLKSLGRETVDVTKDYHAKTVTSIKGELVGNENLLVCVRGHILSVRDGEVHDWTKNRRHRIQSIYKVVCK